MKICIYYNYDYTMGHPTRLWALIKALKKKNPLIEIVILAGGDAPVLLPMQKKATIYSLPYSWDKKAIHIEKRRLFYERIVASGKLNQMLEKRITMMMDVLASFKPDVFLTEFFPLGEEFWTFEIPLLLDRCWSKKTFKVIGSSGYLSYQSQMYEHIQQYYDEILIHSPKEFDEGFIDFIPIRLGKTIRKTIQDFREKITFTSFMMDTQRDKRMIKAIRDKNIFDEKNLVFVSRGGGIVNKELIVSCCLLAKKRTDLFFVICCGPATSDQEWGVYERLCKENKNIDLIRQLSLKEFDQYIFASDVCIAMSGYNTAIRLLYAKKPCVIIPHVSFEQCWRAKQMGKYLPVEILSSQGITTTQLSQALDKVLLKKKVAKKMPEEWFCGAEQTAQRLICLMS